MNLTYHPPLKTEHNSSALKRARSELYNTKWPGSFVYRTIPSLFYFSIFSPSHSRLEKQELYMITTTTKNESKSESKKKKKRERRKWLFREQ